MAAFGIALVYVKDHFRHWMPYLLIACYLLLLLLGSLLPTPDAESRARMLKSFSLNAIGILCIPAALLGTLASLGRDFQTKRMRIIRAKPIRAHILFLGKLLGSILLSLFYSLVFGLAAVIFLHALCSGHLAVHEEIGPASFERLGAGHSEAGEAWVSGFGGRGSFAFTFPRGFAPAGTLKGEILLRARFKKGTYRNEVPIVAGFKNPSTHQEETIEVKVKPGKVRPFSLPAAIAEGGEILARLWCPLKGVSFRIHSDSLQFIGRARGFTLSFFKALIPLFFFMVLMGGLGTACGSFLSIPVAALLGMFILFSGSIVGFLGDYAHTLEREGLYLQARMKDGEEVAVPAGRLIVKSGLQAFCTVWPDWRVFHTARWLEQGRDIPIALLGSAFLYMLKFLLLFFLAGVILLSLREAG